MEDTFNINLNMEYQLTQSNPVSNSSNYSLSDHISDGEGLTYRDISNNYIQTDTHMLENGSAQRTKELQELLQTWHMGHLLNHLISKFYFILMNLKIHYSFIS